MTETDATTMKTDEVEALAADGLRWLLSVARDTGGGGIGWPITPSDADVDPMLYNGTAGVVPVLLEAWRHFGDDSYADAARRAARCLARSVEEWQDDSLYFGRTGMALALRAVHDDLGDPAAGAAADRALELVRAARGKAADGCSDGERWGELYELMGGNAGIGLGALLMGADDLAVQAVEPYARTAEPTAHGVQWQHRPGATGRMHHISHGTLGIVHGLAAVGHAAGRADLVELALAGAADVVSRDEDGPDGFLVPHSDPQHRPDLVQRHNYGWCHGPSGDAQVFRLLRDLTGDPGWQALADRCWHTVTHSGLPSRLRPGFWDNNGRCCGTAGVLALADDRIAEQGDSPDFAEVLVADIAAHATRDTDGARWSNVEHRATPSALEPRTGWAMGSAGIVRELLRHVRISRGGAPAYAFAWPDQPAPRAQATDPIRPAGSDVDAAS
ncbi:lanthionine synthetase LanC family protein [Streptomyces chartreusis]|uniref:Lanthionine synthetase C family protein n=1 Tax=Streptomyces chartreusis TaxID=1969 RepID=A0A7H8T2T1_STRCX|nr:lanthionine synthetase LanC family protein [Streptomyces chartreusis]QKZ17819.1 lanthionine synthetase C family protein [Streptomyces chartreusis]